MRAIRSHYLSRSTCLSLILVMVGGLLVPCLPVAAQTQAKTVLVYPVSTTVENPPSNMTERATGVLTMALDEFPALDAMQFSSTSPSVRRAVSEGRIRQVDVEEGTRDLATALSMGSALGADYIILSSIQSLTRKDTPTQVSLILSGQMYDVPANLNPATGEPLAEPKVYRAFGVSGVSSARARFTGNEGVLVQEALRDAALKAASSVSGRTETAEPRARAKKTDPGYKWVLLGLLLGGLILAVNNGSGDNGNTSPVADAFPPRNLVSQSVDEFIQLRWDPPTGTTLTLLRYEIQRSIDGAGFSTITRLDASRTTFQDTGTIEGLHVYQYRIRAIYNVGQSEYALFGATQLER